MSEVLLWRETARALSQHPTPVPVLGKRADLRLRRPSHAAPVMLDYRFLVRLRSNPTLTSEEMVDLGVLLPDPAVWGHSDGPAEPRQTWRASIAAPPPGVARRRRRRRVTRRRRFPSTD